MLSPPYENHVNPDFLTKIFYLMTGYGHQAVMIFFVLSGFLVGGRVIEKFEKNDFQIDKYLADRFSRLYPVYFASLILGGALDWLGHTNFISTGIYTASQANPVGVIGYDAQSRLGATDFLINLFMLQGLIGPSFGSNGPLWSIAMEFWYYVTFPLLLIPLYAQTWNKRVIYLFALAPILYLLSLNGEFFALFAVWLLGVFSRKIRLPIKNTLLAFFFLTLFLANARFGYGGQYIRDLLVGAGCTLVIAAILNGGFFPLTGSNFSKTASGFSYSVYAFHFPIIALTVSAMQFNVNESTTSIAYRYTAFILVCLLCIGISYVLSRITEARTLDVRDFLKKRVLRVQTN
jgi:peptidoglycan/LPS O-acetylase OafA/YrhL